MQSDVPTPICSHIGCVGKVFQKGGFYCFDMFENDWFEGMRRGWDTPD